MVLEIMLTVLVLEGIIALIPMIVLMWSWVFDELHRVGDTNKKSTTTRHKRSNMYIPKGSTRVL